MPLSPFAFQETLALRHLGELRSEAQVTTLQVNVGKRCNQACKHCHVEAGPLRTEVMSLETVEEVLTVVRRFRVPILDITGGALEKAWGRAKQLLMLKNPS